MLRIAVLLVALSLSASAVGAQGHQHRPEAPGWSWALDGRGFLNANLQDRKFRDFHQVESQNWFMAEASRPAGRGRFRLHVMASLEPLTLRRLGSAQAFQTGETLDEAPLIDYQHPHDLFMALEARYERSVGGRWIVWASAAPVGPASLGPTAFMHRPSAADNPSAPLAHHYLDSAHITRSVVAFGVERGGVSLEGSVFHGREPDENRFDLDLGAPDSWAARVRWTSDVWRVQFSGGRAHAPETVEPFVDVTRLVASVEYAGTLAGRPLSVTVAAGRNREFYGNIDGALVEATWSPASAHRVYSRAEVVEKNILTAGGLHPPGFTHPHEFSTLGAVTAGYVRELASSRAGFFAAGADVTLHAVPINLRESYGRPWSVHAFLRWSAKR